jgi:hypothetical protein
MKKRVGLLLCADIWRCCNGRETMDVHGMKRRVSALLRAEIWRCCSGCEKMDVQNLSEYTDFCFRTNISASE